jgi:predicted KAP-like P-loop ATPase
VDPFYGGAVVAAGQAIETAATATKATTEAAQAAVGGDQPTLSELKADIVRDMGKLRTPILAVIDDIDRLTTDEIRQVFQLVKANANFPNLIFLLMFDRVIVGKALDGVSDGRGDEFLEKIVQVPFDVPEASAHGITKALFAPLDSILEDKAIKRHWNQDRWLQLWHEGMGQYFRTLRHVYRFSGPLEFLLRQMKSAKAGESLELNFVDMLGIETLRIFEPALYNRLRTEKDFACGRATRFEYDKEEAARTRQHRFDELLSLVPNQRREQAGAILKNLFPRFLNPDDGGKDSAGRP